MPWRGPETPGEFPTLGYLVADWIEAWCVIPDGDAAGEPFLLTDEMVRFLLWFYRVDPGGKFEYRGGQLRRSQKWGKGPFAGAISWAEALGPVRFDGWDAAGEPVGKPWATPLIQHAAVSEDQSDNTFGATYQMAVRGPLADWPGLDLGITRVNLPNRGQIEPVTASAPSRLGQRLTFVVLDESHLLTESNGGVRLAANMRRNVAGMNGRWLETTNAYDPAEASVAQRTDEGKAPDVHIDARPAPDVSLTDKRALKRALRVAYGDSHWVDLDRIIAEIHDPSTAEADARRFFLNQIVVGTSDFIDPVAWAAASDGEPLRPGDLIALGFDGSKGGATGNPDCTALWASRLSDGRLFKIGFWQRPRNHLGEWYIPKAEVRERLEQTFTAFQVAVLFGDPWKWQDEMSDWSATWPDRIVEFPTNIEQRMDAAIERFLTGFRASEITHDGDMILTQHLRDTALTKGARKKPRPGETVLANTYLRLVKKKHTVHIDATVAAVLAHEARSWAIEHGLNVDLTPSVNYA